MSKNKSTATTATTSSDKNDGFIKRSFRKAKDKAVEKTEGLVGKVIHGAAKSALIGAGAFAGERLIEHAVEGYSGKDIKWTLDGESGTFGVAIVDNDSKVEVTDRSMAGKRNYVDFSVGGHTNVGNLSPSQAIVGVSVGDDNYGISKQGVYHNDLSPQKNEADTVVAGPSDESTKPSMSDAFSQSSTEAVSEVAEVDTQVDAVEHETVVREDPAVDINYDNSSFEMTMETEME